AIASRLSGLHTWARRLRTPVTHVPRVHLEGELPCLFSILPTGEQQESRATAINSDRPTSEGAGGGQRTCRIVARVIVAVLLGIVTGYGGGQSMASDVARGRALTMKEYVANFDEYRNKLMGNGSPLWAAVVAGVFMVLAAVAVYELLVWVVDKVLAALDRRRVRTDQPGTPPPW